MRVLNTLYVTSHRARVSCRAGSLLVRDPDQGQTRVPIEALEAIVLLAQAQVTTQAISLCVAKGVRLTALARNGKVRFTVGAATSGNVHLRVAQYEAHQEPAHTAELSRQMVAGKLQNARRVVNRWVWDSDGAARFALREHGDGINRALAALETASDADRIRGLEGDGSRRYFRALHIALAPTPFAFHVRTRRPPRDPANALLSFTYGLVLGEVTGAIEALGLDPQIGFLHRLRPGRPSLALDLIEELRPSHADRFAVRLMRRREISPEHFISAPGGACYLTDAGRRVVLNKYEDFRDEEVDHILLNRKLPRWSLPQVQATLLARHLRGDLPAYPPFLMVP